MILKLNDLTKNFNFSHKFYLLYGANTGRIEEVVDKILKPKFSKNIYSYDESEIILNVDEFEENVLNKSFFENDKLIIINRGTDRLLEIIKKLVSREITEVTIIIKANILEKKSKLRNFFEKNKSTVITAFYEDNYQSLLLMVLDFFKEKKINVSNEIINLIIEKSKRNRIYLTNELEKILSYSKKNNKIVLADVLKLLSLAENNDISELVDQNLLKNKKKTISILNENNLNTEENILILRTFLNKLKRLKKLKVNLEKDKNIELILSSYKPPIFWKDKEIVKKQLNVLSLIEIKYLIYKINNLELNIKKNIQISNQLLNNFIFENLVPSNNLT